MTTWVLPNGRDSPALRSVLERSGARTPERGCLSASAAMATKNCVGLQTSDTDASGEPYTYHVEPPAQGGKTYARCEACGAELLTDLGGKRTLVHVDGCPNAGEGPR